MTPRSLSGRMLLVSAIATLVALGLGGLAMATLLERFVVEGLDRRLDADLALMASVVGPDGRIDTARLAARRAALGTGREWRWRIEAPGGTVGSADFPALAGPIHPGPPPFVTGPGPAPTGDAPPAPPPPGVAAPDARPLPPDMEGPQPLDGNEDGSAIHARRLVLATRAGPVTLTAAAPRDVVRRPIRAALLPLLAALAVLGALLAAAMVVQLRVGLRPLRRLRDQVAAIRAGTRATVDEDQPSELRPLAIELNALAADNAATLATARATAANLAHALKTPVATLALDLTDRPAEAAQVARIDATIRHHLARARAQAANHRAATPLDPALPDLATAVRRLHAARGVTIALSLAPGLAVAMDAQDLDELAGNLLDNAARHARAAVTVSAARDADPRRVRLTIEDDGPGIPAADRARVAQAGTRLDEAGDGHGFGLSIARELVALYGGVMTLDDAAGGGLSVVLLLPAAGPAA